MVELQILLADAGASDEDVDITDFNSLAANFDPADGDVSNKPESREISMAMKRSTSQTSIS